MKLGNTTSYGTGGIGSGSGSAGAAPSNQLQRQDFLTLLVAQMGHQDPLQPMDSQDFLTQLSQLSSVETGQATNAKLDLLLAGIANANQVSTASLVGRDAVFRTSQVSLPAEGGVTLMAQARQAVESVTAVVKDASGRVVRTLTTGPQAAGEVNLAWDGRDANGSPLPAGAYTVELSATTATGGPGEIELRGRGRITGLSFEAGYAELLVGDTRISLSDIVEFHVAG